MKQKKKILIAIINNRKDIPAYFAYSLLNLYLETNKEHLANIVQVSRCSIDNMRNDACRMALGQNINKIKYDYLFMLDSDHLYPSDCILKLIKHNEDFVVGIACRRQHPFNIIQYRKKGRKIEYLKGKEGLVEIHGTGVVGALIKTKMLENLKFPYFKRFFKADGTTLSSDIYFCKKCSQNGLKLKCDTSVSYPHEVTGFADKGQINFNSSLI